MSARTFWLVNLALALALSLLFQQTAHAETLRKSTKPEAVQHFDAGVAHYKLGNWQAALDEFTKSALVEITPATDFNMAQCYRMLAEKIDQDPEIKKQHFEKALWLYRNFLRTTQNTPEHVQRANENTARVQAALAELKKNESELSQPAPLPSSSTPPAQAAVPTAAVTTTAPPHRSTDWLAIGLVTAGGIGVIVGGGLLWDASSLREDAKNTTEQSVRNALYDKADTRSLTGTIIGIGGVALVGTGLIKLVLDSRGSASTSSAWNVSASANGVVVFGQF